MPGSIEARGPLANRLLDVDLADAFLLTNRFHLVSNLVRKTRVVRDGLDHYQRRRGIGSVELNIFDSAEPVEKRLLSLNVFDPVKLQGVGDLAENSLARFQTFRRHFVNSAFRLEITFRSDKDWHGQEKQNVRTELLHFGRRTSR